MKLKQLLEKFNINTKNIPQTMLNYESQNYEEMHKETVEENKEITVFTKKEGNILYEGILDTDEKVFTEFSKEGTGTRYSNGGVDEDGIFI